jgi:hypothetical protein
MLSTTISSILGREHARDLRADAKRVRSTTSELPHGVTIRVATSADFDALERLAQLDCRPVPTGHVLVAAVEGELWAALPVDGGEPVADPFHPTVALTSLLALRARQLRAGEAESAPAAARRRLVAVAGR